MKADNPAQSANVQKLYMVTQIGNYPSAAPNFDTGSDSKGYECKRIGEWTMVRIVSANSSYSCLVVWSADFERVNP